MIRVKSTILVIILMILATFTVGITAETVLKKNEQEDIVQQSMIDAEIKFIVQSTNYEFSMLTVNCFLTNT